MKTNMKLGVAVILAGLFATPAAIAQESKTLPAAPMTQGQETMPGGNMPGGAMTGGNMPGGNMTGGDMSNMQSMMAMMQMMQQMGPMMAQCTKTMAAMTEQMKSAPNGQNSNG